MNRRSLLSSIGIIIISGCVERNSNEGSGTEQSRETSPQKDTTQISPIRNETSENTTASIIKDYTVTGPTQPSNTIQSVERSENTVTIYLDGYETMEYAEMDILPVSSSSDESLTLTEEQVQKNPPLQNGLAFYNSELDEVEVNAGYKMGQRVKRRLKSYWREDGRDTDRLIRERTYEFQGVRFSVGFKFYG